ncbi:MAG: hypothetical protein WC360_05620, partial [Opitutales bacterium]
CSGRFPRRAQGHLHLVFHQHPRGACRPGGNLTDGFYVYRYATSSWGWTSYYGQGSLYDYGINDWVDITPVPPPVGLF